MKWSPARFIDYTNQVLWYPFGNTCAKNFFEECDSASSALLLGCGDLRNMLETCRASPDAKELMFALVDINPSIIARNALLLAACEKMDPSKPRDLDFLWSIWYNLELSSQQHRRMKQLVDELLQGRDHQWFEISSRSWKAVSEVLKSWLTDTDDLPEVNSVKRERIARAEKFINIHLRGGGKAKYKDLEPQILRPISYSLGPEKINVKDAQTSWEHGSIHTQGKTMANLMVPNVTLLHHRTREWLVHYGLCPFRSYLHAVTSRHVKKAGGLAKACQKHLGIWVRELLRRIREDSINIQLSAENALDYCWREGMKFDVIDTSNLVDHVGLLNLLVFGGSRLTPKVDSKLYTSVLLWYHDRPISELVIKSLGFDLAMTPSVLGLELVSYGTNEIASCEEEAEYVQKEKYILWRPSLVPNPPLTVDPDNIDRLMTTSPGESIPDDICALTRSLCELTAACCFLPDLVPPSRAEFSCQMSTVATVASLVYSLFESRAHLASDQSPEDMLIALCKGYCVSFALEAEIVLRLMDQARGGLVQFTGNIASQAQPCHGTIIFRILLVHKSAVAQNLLLDESMQSQFFLLRMLLGNLRNGDLAKSVHLLDSVSIDDDRTVSFLLPDDHGLKVSDWRVIQVRLDEPPGRSLQSITNMTEFSSCKVASGGNLKKTPLIKENNLVQEGLRIESVTEYDTLFVVFIHYNGSPEGLFTKYYQLMEGRLASPSCAVDVGFRKPEVQQVTLHFSSPVTSEGSTFCLFKSEFKLECRFNKVHSHIHEDYDNLSYAGSSKL